MAGEANTYAMGNSFIPATEDELDRWLQQATYYVVENEMLSVEGAAELFHGVVPRLVQEVVLTRSFVRLKKDDLEEARRRERANAVLLQRAEEALRVSEQRRVAAEEELRRLKLA